MAVLAGLRQAVAVVTAIWRRPVRGLELPVAAVARSRWGGVGWIATDLGVKRRLAVRPQLHRIEGACAARRAG